MSHLIRKQPWLRQGGNYISFFETNISPFFNILAIINSSFLQVEGKKKITFVLLVILFFKAAVLLKIVHIIKESPELAIVRTLFQEYAEELNENLRFQSFDEELKDPLKKYGPPKGTLLLAFWNNEAAGCVALQPLQNYQCEMKRLYVRPAYRALGLGEELVKAILKEAAQSGYEKMVLDTLQRLQPAIRLYLRHGFTNTSAYYKNPLPDVVYMERVL